MESKLYEIYTGVLKKELIPAMGCTEPIAVAYASALAKELLARYPESVELTVSGNIVKNVKSVVVPNTESRKGLKTAVAAGVCFGDPRKELEVISQATEDDRRRMVDFIDNCPMVIKKSDSDNPFDIQVMLKAGEDSSYVRIAGHHTNVVEKRKNGQLLFSKEFEDKNIKVAPEKELLNVADIYEFAKTVELSQVEETIERQIDYNTRIADYGLEHHCAADIGNTLLKSNPDSVKNRARAYAAAGSDARMDGCELPVIINSGSGNQGMTTSLPVIVYARDRGSDREELIRALTFANLITIHLKTGIGSLSAYCGATSAGIGAASGINFLLAGSREQIEHSIVNALAINSGMVCDGAKPSCSAKVASAIEAAILGMQMYKNGNEFHAGDGIVADGVENTIAAVGDLARRGMRVTDDVIIEQMTRD